MTRIKRDIKNITVSVSVTPYQKIFIDTHPTFQFSKFIQIQLNDYINLQHEIEYLEKKFNITVKEEKIK